MGLYQFWSLLFDKDFSERSYFCWRLINTIVLTIVLLMAGAYVWNTYSSTAFWLLTVAILTAKLMGRPLRQRYLFRRERKIMMSSSTYQLRCYLESRLAQLTSENRTHHADCPNDATTRLEVSVHEGSNAEGRTYWVMFYSKQFIHVDSNMRNTYETRRELFNFNVRLAELVRTTATRYHTSEDTKIKWDQVIDTTYMPDECSDVLERIEQALSWPQAVKA